MSSEISPQAPGSTLSKATERSAHSEAIVALGKKLVAELALDDSVDTLGRWMTHYVAELLHKVETTTGDDLPAAHAQLRDAILALWSHRFELPTGKRPFNDFEPILRALASLDPESLSFRYFSPSHVPSDESQQSKATRKWVGLALAFDQSAKLFVNYCLTSAAEAALDKSSEWVEFASRAGLDESFEFSVIRFIRDESDLLREPTPNEVQRRILTNRREKLGVFLSVAAQLANEIDAQLNSLPTSVVESDKPLDPERQE